MALTRRQFLGGAFTGGIVLGSLALPATARRGDQEFLLGGETGAELCPGWRVERVYPPFAGGIDVLCGRQGEHVRLQVRAIGGRVAPVAASDRAAVYVMNGGQGDVRTPCDHRALAAALAQALERAERPGLWAMLRPKGA